MGCCVQKNSKNLEQQNEIVTNEIKKEDQKIITQIAQENKKQQIKEEEENKTSQKVVIQPTKERDTNQISPIQEKYLMLLGTAGVGKSTLFNQLELQHIQNIPNETTATISDYYREGQLNEFYFTDTPSFQLDDDIDTREIFIKGFQEYFEKRKFISSFGIVVNFERTDLMKKKVLQVLKYIRKFIGIISIIVVNMELSENQDEDKQHLKNSFKHMGCNKIIFISQKMKKLEILEQIKEIEFKKTQIDLTDTIFEKITQSEENRQVKELQIRLGQRLDQ